MFFFSISLHDIQQGWMIHYIFWGVGGGGGLLSCEELRENTNTTQNLKPLLNLAVSQVVLLG